MARARPPVGPIHELGHFDVPDLPGRRVRIYEPLQKNRGAPRPALFLLDGQNVFEDHGSFAGGWHAHVAVSKLGDRTMIAPYVVAIPHGGDRRIDELGPWRHGHHGGRADTFFDWVAGTLVPEVRRRFHLPEGPVGAALGGSSMGGLGALYGHFRHPDVFGGALCMSPSFWFAYPEPYRYFGGHPKPHISRVYIDCGAHEARGRMLPAARQMAELLASRGYDKGQLKFRSDPRGRHTEKDWRRRLPAALRFMYRR